MIKTLSRKMNVGHFAFYRGWLEGLALADLGERYLVSGRDLPKAKQTLRWIQDELIAAARRSKPALARILRLSPSQVSSLDVAQNTSLEGFQAEVDPEGFYTESELVELYQAHFGPGQPDIDRKARRNERLLRKLRDTINWLEGWVAVDPVLADPINVWFDTPIAERLQAAGIVTLEDMICLMKKHGQQWYRKVPKTGPVMAGRLQRWLAENELLPAERLPATVRPSLHGQALEAGIVPLERLLMPGALSGVSGSNRAYSNKLEARDDYAAIQTWLRSIGSKVHTVRSYRSQAERFLLWMIFERQKPLSSATTEDCISYRDFLDSLDENRLWFWHLPRKRWIGSRSTPRWSEEWRPFSGPLAPSSQRQAVTILTAMFEWLMRQRYLETNPWDGVPSNHAHSPRIRADHSLSMAQWQTCIATVEEMPVCEKYYRLRLALLFAYGLGLRLSEITDARIAQQQERNGRPNPGLRRAIDGNGWDIEVIGKGQKLRTVPVPNAVISALSDYGYATGLGREIGNWPAGQQIFMTLGDGSWRAKKKADYERQAMSQSQVYRMFKELFRLVARRLPDATDAGHLWQASTHWLRHTHATHALEAGAEIEEVQENLGHSSVAVTAIYTHASRKRRKAAVEKLMAFAELS